MNFVIHKFIGLPPHLLPKELTKRFSISEKIRLALRSLRTYNVYYIIDDGKAIGYCFIKKNYLNKYSFMDRKDVIINPYLVDEAYRGQHLGEKMIQYAMDDMCSQYSTMWAVIEKDNIASIKTVEKLGFSFKGYAKSKCFAWKLCNEQTNLVVYNIKSK